MHAVFEDLKVVDFTWVLAGPLVTRFLSPFGATVVRIESAHRPDAVRTSNPFKDRKVGINRSGYFAYLNPNKYGMAVNLRHREAMSVVKRLINWGDVVVENFSPGTMESLGLGYDDIKKMKPDIIMVRVSSQGQTGPLAQHPGFGHHLVALTGFCFYTGWPDRDPAALSTAYTDGIIPRFAAAAIISALIYRNKTGKGQLLDLSQLEAGIHFQTPVFLDYSTNKNIGGRSANYSSCAAPHGVYPCKGNDRWCAIAVFTDNEWRGFCETIGNPPWTKNSKFNTFLSRKRNEEELNEFVKQWTMSFTAEEVMRMLQEAGVPAGVVKNSKDLYEDPQLKGRNNLWMLDHKEMGNVAHLGEPFKMSKTPAEPRRPAPCLGEHTEYICKEFLNMPDDEFDRLLVAGVFE